MAEQTAASTVEQLRSHLFALEDEREGYVRRRDSKKGGVHLGMGLDLSVEQLADRIKQVDAEIGATERLLGKGSRAA